MTALPASPLPPALGDEARASVAARASLAARRNRPVHILLLAGVLLAVCAIAAVVTGVDRASARARLSRVTQETSEIARLSAQLQALRKAAADPSRERAAAAGGQVLSRIYSAANAAGLTSVTQTPTTDSRPGRDRGVTRNNYLYREVRDESLERLLGWVAAAVRDVPLLEVTRLRVRPEANGWVMDVTFSRWERNAR